MTPEASLKKRCKDHVEDVYEGKLVHLSAKGENGYPDSDLMIPHTPLVKVEFKKPGEKKLESMQLWWRTRLRLTGFHCWTINDYDDFVRLCREHHDTYYDSTTTARRSRPMANG